jgi:hypothetical protein
VHLVGFTTEICYDARSYKRKEKLTFRKILFFGSKSVVYDLSTKAINQTWRIRDPYSTQHHDSPRAVFLCRFGRYTLLQTQCGSFCCPQGSCYRVYGKAVISYVKLTSDEIFHDNRRTGRKSIKDIYICIYVYTVYIYICVYICIYSVCEWST